MNTEFLLIIVASQTIINFICLAWLYRRISVVHKDLLGCAMLLTDEIIKQRKEKK